MMTPHTISCSLPGLPGVPKERGFALRSLGTAAIRRSSIGYCNQKSLGDRRLRSSTTSRCFLLDLVVQSGVDPASQLPSDASDGPWAWVLGLGGIVSVLLSFTKSKWGPLLKFKNEADSVLQTAEDVVERVERVAKEVENTAEGVAGILPEGGKLRTVAKFIEGVAEETAKDAHLVDGFIDKVQELEKEVDEGVESLLERPARSRPVSDGDVDGN
ncbi:hypothetical protein SAY87_019643 [Trapa incisa]|uniref:Uncharacterized protein n=2 Tax=Trapa TaxID=22665 RepID=A0AAN7LVQ6_TRANT|nr:hypothetical protein SAY87_019643 [Trapa incisa]KAK4792969.1 hypothetical protein SAY86_023404 [Trapa natans]